MRQQPDMNRAGDRWWQSKRDALHWQMPRAAWWKRLPVIRHYRSVTIKHIYPARGKGEWVSYGIRRGFERPLKG
jgi:hypothetical protein